MKNITDSVARLYRAGSEHSKSAQKLREAVDELLLWMSQNVPKKFDLPMDCSFDPESGLFSRPRAWDPLCPRPLLQVRRGTKHSRETLLRFSELIAYGFLDKLSTYLEKEAGTISNTTAKIEEFVAAKSYRTSPGGKLSQVFHPFYFAKKFDSCI